MSSNFNRSYVMALSSQIHIYGCSMEIFFQPIYSNFAYFEKNITLKCSIQILELKWSLQHSLSMFLNDIWLSQVLWFPSKGIYKEPTDLTVKIVNCDKCLNSSGSSKLLSPTLDCSHLLLICICSTFPCWHAAFVHSPLVMIPFMELLDHSFCLITYSWV